MKLTILYRGSLLSCNYGCEYCPFAKQQQSASELAQDKKEIEKFINWVESQKNHEFTIFFTPWGEALIHSWYQQTLVNLSHLNNVKKAVIQTNLSCQIDWIENSNPYKLALWTTFHPEWSNLQEFLAKCYLLREKKIKFSVGVVGFPHFKSAIQELRKKLPTDIYLWINAVKKELSKISSEDLDFFTKIDPLFELNKKHYPSLNHSCRTGNSVISVDGNGIIRRCHFIKEPLGNIYDSNFEQVLKERVCTNEICHCHIGYVHLDYLKLNEIFGDKIIERIPLNYH